MSTEYAERKTKEILIKVNGQAKLAEQAMRTLIQRDPAFLLSLVELYLSGIITHAIERARKPSGLKEPKPAAATSAKVLPKKPATAKAVTGNTMDSMMKAWAKSFEKDAPQANEPGKKVSANHLAAMHALIKKK